MLTRNSGSYFIIGWILLFSFAFAHEGPIIGIVTEELTNGLQEAFPNYTSYIAASYVKAVEGSGGRVVPILIGQNQEYYRKQVSLVNGIVLPGGACLFDVPNGYAEASSFIYDLAIQVNQKKDYFPILGICLGFEILLHLSNSKKELRTRCRSSNVGLPLQFVPGFRHSRLYEDASLEVLFILSSLPVTSNHHQYCITTKNLSESGLNKEWKTLSLSDDDNGLAFISSIESTLYPFVGVQFHPEKNMYEWRKTQNNPHSRKAILSARYFYDWIVNEASKNNHSFSTESELLDALIYNYPVYFTSKQDLYFEQVYLFK